MGKYIAKFTDYDSERSSVVIPTSLALGSTIELDAITAALVGITIGTRGEVNHVVEEQLEVDDVSQPASPFAQRETKWLVTYQDSVNGRLGQFEVPTADLLVLGGSGEADDGNAAVIAFKAAVNPYLRSRDGNAATITSIKHVGRNI